MNDTKLSPQEKQSLLETLSVKAQNCSYINPALYTKFEVKRGLRDISGRGVLAGLTDIGEIRAYSIEENELVPAPGKLIYRGLDIQDLTSGFLSEKRYGFEEICYLLLCAELPNKENLAAFKKLLSECQEVSNSFINDVILQIPSKDMMNVLARCVLALYSLDENADNISIPNVFRQSIELIARLPLIAVYGYQAYIHNYLNQSLVIHAPNPKLSFAENILYMLRPNSKYTQLEATLLDLSLVLHAEHGGGNNSTFTTHVVTSSGTDTYSAIASAIVSLKGPRHGGANIKVIQMFQDMNQYVKDWENINDIKGYLEKIVNKEAFDRTGLVYGFGHAVYSISDPRSEIFKRYVHQLAREKNFEEEFNLYAKVEELAPQIIGQKRKMYKGVCANVDFYSGLVYKMLGIPEELYTPLFAIARIVGWTAHRIEELRNTGKIIRPAYKSVTPMREYVNLDNR